MLHQIGAGSLGPVFRAEDPASQTSVVIKVLRLNLTPERARIVADELSALQDRIPAHPGIAPIVKAGIRDVEPFVVCAFMPGDSLDVTLRELGPSALPEVLPRLVQIAAGLDFCADASIWHGSLHPRDVLVSASETAVVGVGIAPILERVGVKLPVRRPYTAPEVVEGLVTGPAADQFSLAAIVFEWLYGRRITGPAQGRIEVPDMPGIDRTAMADAFTSALATDPAVRFESASAFVAALADAMEKADESPRPTPVRIASRRPRPVALTSIVPSLPDESRGTAALRDTLADASGSSDVETATTSRIDELRPAEAASENRGADRQVGARRVPVRRSPLSLLNVLTAVAAAILIGSGVGYWFAIHPTADSNDGRSVQQQPPAPAASPPAPPATGAGGTEAPAAGDTPGAATPTPAPVPPDVSPALAAPVPPVATSGRTADPTGRMLVRSTPAGADVVINGERRGVTPLALRELPFGLYVISVSRAGFSSQQHQVSLTAARPSQSLEISLAGGAGVSGGSVTSSTIAAPGATVGSLLIESRPVGAKVFIDGRAAGITPIMLDRLAPGAHAVRLELSGYHAWTTTVSVVPGELTRLAASLAGGHEHE